MQMDTILYRRLEMLEQHYQRAQVAPTFPIYDVANMPQDAVEAQIVIGTDDSINWFDGTNWQTNPGSAAAPNNVPQDPLEGQIVLGSDNSLCWYSNGNWHGVAGSLATGNPPQDSLEGQIALGVDNSLCWFVGGAWYGISAS